MPWETPAIIERISERIQVVRDDLLEGGSKMRFLPYLVVGAKEIVYGGPFCGGAPYALSVYGRITGTRVALFFAKRKQLHPRQVKAFRNGAKVVQVYPGYMTVVQARARAYAEAVGAMFLPLGFDLADAETHFVKAIAKVRESVGQIDEVWCATGSGMLARCLALGFPDATVHGVCVGLASRHEAQAFPINVRLHEAAYRFEQLCKQPCPFPSDGNYDAKAWELCQKLSVGRVLFWNVLG